MSRSVHSVKLNPYHSSQLSSLSYTLGDVVFDQDNLTLRVMDGSTFGGNTLANQNWTQSYINTVFSSAVLTVGNITNSNNTYPSGALRIAGGLSIKKDTYMDGSLKVNTDLTVIGNLNATITTSSQTNITTLGTLTSLTSQGAVTITNNTATTQLGQGALQVSGGASIAGNLYVGGTLNLTGSQLDISSATFSNGVTVSGSTTPATEYFTITNGAATPTTTFRVDTANGNLVTSGSITAASFVGGVATISDTAPTLTASGSLWFSSVTGGLYLKYTSGEWVQVYSPGSGSSAVSMALVFPASPSNGQVYTAGTSSWQWDGVSWNVVSASGALASFSVDTDGGLVLVTQDAFGVENDTTIQVVDCMAAGAVQINDLGVLP